MLAETLPKPDWLKVRFHDGDRYRSMLGLMRQQQLHTVCEEAHCPNVGECWNAGAATFMILGDVCTRSCGFCAVTSGKPIGLDLLEPLRLARTVEALGLDYCVITSVNRDDLDDGGASVFAACIRAIRRRLPACRVEVLIPDFEGNWEAVRTVVEADPVVLNHNTETVPRLYPRVRPKARYQRSLDVSRNVKRIDPTMTTKSGVMVGLGETMAELVQTMRDLRDHECDLLTVGQYLRPDEKHLPVVRYWTPDEFAEVKRIGMEMGFRHVEAGPLVRSSYHAGEQARMAGQPILSVSKDGSSAGRPEGEGPSAWDGVAVDAAPASRLESRSYGFGERAGDLSLAEPFMPRVSPLPQTSRVLTQPGAIPSGRPAVLRHAQDEPASRKPRHA